MCSVDSVWRWAGVTWAWNCPHLWGASWENRVPTANSRTRAPALEKKGHSSVLMGTRHWGGSLSSWTSWIFRGPHSHKDASLSCGLGWAVWGGGSWTRRRTFCPWFPQVCLWCVSAWDPSGSSCFVVAHLLSLWLWEVSRLYFPESLPAPVCPLSGTGGCWSLAGPPSWTLALSLLRLFSALLPGGPSSSLVHTFFLLLLLLFSELAAPLSFWNEHCVFSWQIPLVLLLQDFGSYLSVLFGSLLPPRSSLWWAKCKLLFP